MSVTQPHTGGAPLPRCLPGGAVGLCALALLRKFADWQDRASALDDTACEYLNGAAWDDLGRMADQARALLAQVDRAPQAAQVPRG